jgi:hypothetical protein
MSPPAHAGLGPDAALTLGLAPYPTVVGFFDIAGSRLDSTRFSVNCQNESPDLLSERDGDNKAICREKCQFNTMDICELLRLAVSSHFLSCYLFTTCAMIER